MPACRTHGGWVRWGGPDVPPDKENVMHLEWKQEMANGQILEINTDVPDEVVYASPAHAIVSTMDRLVNDEISGNPSVFIRGTAIIRNDEGTGYHADDIVPDDIDAVVAL